MSGSDPKVLNFVKNSPFYQKFRERRYRNPAKYCPWDAAALNLSESCIAAYISGVEGLDECGRHAAFNAWHLFKTGGPVYWCAPVPMSALRLTGGGGAGGECPLGKAVAAGLGDGFSPP